MAAQSAMLLPLFRYYTTTRIELSCNPRHVSSWISFTLCGTTCERQCRLHYTTICCLGIHREILLQLLHFLGACMGIYIHIYMHVGGSTECDGIGAISILNKCKAYDKGRNAAIHHSIKRISYIHDFHQLFFMSAQSAMLSFLSNVTQVAASIHTCSWQHRVRCICSFFDTTQLYELSSAIIHDMSTHEYNSCCAAQRANHKIDRPTINNYVNS